MARRRSYFGRQGATPRRELPLIFAESHPGETARVLERLQPAEAAAFLRLAPARIGAPVLRRMLPIAAAGCLALLDDALAVGLLREIDTQSAAALLRHLDTARRDRLIGDLPTRAALAFRLMLGYPLDAVGAWIKPHALALPPDTPVATALERVRQSPEAGDRLFVVDDSQRLLGVLTLGEALRAAHGAALGQVMQPPPAVLSARARLRAARARPEWTEHPTLPVAEHGGRFIGTLELAVLCRALDEPESVSAPVLETSDGATLARGTWTVFAGLLQAAIGLLPAPARARRSSDVG